MNFKVFENIENQAASAEQITLSKEAFDDYLKKQEKKAKADENPFVYFYEDVISSTIGFNFESAIGGNNYNNASGDAKSCLNICNDFYKLSSWDVNGWLQNALKFIDNIVLHYIQDYCKETPKTYLKTGVEKSRYIHLSEKGGDISTAGAELKDLYDLRNDLEHRTKIHSDGRQELVPPKRNKVRKIVVKLYPDTLRRILTTYKTVYPTLNN